VLKPNCSFLGLWHFLQAGPVFAEHFKVLLEAMAIRLEQLVLVPEY